MAIVTRGLGQPSSNVVASGYGHSLVEPISAENFAVLMGSASLASTGRTSDKASSSLIARAYSQALGRVGSTAASELSVAAYLSALGRSSLASRVGILAKAELQAVNYRNIVNLIAAAHLLSQFRDMTPVIEVEIKKRISTAQITKLQPKIERHNKPTIQLHKRNINTELRKRNPGVQLHKRSSQTEVHKHIKANLVAGARLQAVSYHNTAALIAISRLLGQFHDIGPSIQIDKRAGTVKLDKLEPEVTYLSKAVTELYRRIPQTEIKRRNLDTEVQRRTPQTEVYDPD